MVLTSRPALRCALFLAGAALAAGCPSSGFANPLLRPTSALSARAPIASGQTPLLVATGGKTGLEYWPLSPKGGHTPTEIAGLRGLSPSGGIVGNGQQIVIPNGTNVVVYNLQSKRETILPDPDGYPTDAAIGKDGALYIANFVGTGGNVLVYPPGGKPHELACGLLKDPSYVAVDNEGDVFVNDTLLTAVVEIPNAPAGPDAAPCTQLKLTPSESGYVAGIAIDPKTDDLLVLDDPDECAGGIEGELFIYSKPYGRQTGRSLDLGQNCSGDVRLNADSSVVFIGDETVDGSSTYILQHTYPDGKSLGPFSGGNPGGFVSIPNTLPN
jgi:hypothetical protein